MPRNSVFELFELLCVELAGRATPQVIDENNLSDDTLIDELKRVLRQTSPAAAFEKGVEAIAAHFTEKDAVLPFSYDLCTRQFTPTDPDYLNFIAFATSHRGSGTESRDFENQAMTRLRKRLSGSLRRVGHPRGKHKKKAEFLTYLKTLGFDDNALEPRDKDGGFDILWLPPIGTIPLRPIVSVQCKNSSFDAKDAAASVERSGTTLARHSHLRRAGTMQFVVFNDYIEPKKYVGRATGWGFLPLGLSDLADASATLLTHTEQL
jgi:hypothetical protein